MLLVRDLILDVDLRKEWFQRLSNLAISNVLI